MSRLEFCKKVLELVGGKWPYPGALADASGWYTTKTPEEVAAWMLEPANKRNWRGRKPRVAK